MNSISFGQSYFRNVQQKGEPNERLSKTIQPFCSFKNYQKESISVVSTEVLNQLISEVRSVIRMSVCVCWLFWRIRKNTDRWNPSFGVSAVREETRHLEKSTRQGWVTGSLRWREERVKFCSLCAIAMDDLLWLVSKNGNKILKVLQSTCAHFFILTSSNVLRGNRKSTFVKT